MRLYIRFSSGWFAVERGLRQGCVLAAHLLDIFFAAVINVSYTRFKADEDIMDALVHLGKKRGGGGQLPESQSWRRCCRACFTLTMSGSSRNPPEQPRKMMGGIVVVCARLSSSYRRSSLRKCDYARRGCRSPPPHSV